MLHRGPDIFQEPILGCWPWKRLRGSVERIFGPEAHQAVLPGVSWIAEHGSEDDPVRCDGVQL